VSASRQATYLVALAIVAIVLAHVLDGPVFRAIRIERIHDQDLGRMFRVMGFLPLWLFAGAALLLHERPRLKRAWRSRGGLLIAGATLGGIAAELLKLVVRRLRPGELGEYVFRPYTERPFSTGGLGLPSSHALVAFGAAAILSRMFPRAWVVWWLLAWGCAFTRVAAGAHFFSDVVAAAIVGWAIGALVWRWRVCPAAAQVPLADTAAP
jgi:membrane-associated phospholipid phosphatase